MMTTLRGKAEEVGYLFGKVAKDSIRDIAVSTDPPKDWEVRVKRLKRIMEEVAPHWLEEGEAIAKASGVDFSLILAHNLPSHSDDCTSFIALSTKDGFPILHKNRDFAIQKQSFFIKKIDGCLKFIAGASPLDLGIAYFLNEAGLAGACNTGGYTDVEPTDALLDRHIMRLVAEKAKNNREALQIVEEMRGRGFLSTEGENRGFILLFLDREGGMVIEYTPKEARWKMASEGMLIRSNSFLLLENKREDISSQQRLKRAFELLGGKGKVKLDDIWETARDRSGSYPICNHNTVSAFSVLLHPLIPSLSIAFCFPGPPDKVVPFPLSIVAEETPEELLRGDYWVNPGEV
ncbi:MAG: C45 family autoproteolytic acyltransferase/hydrolase [bacterium]